ncbi:cell envelope biogenesis protein TolA [Methylosinus sp. H3A]|uniref:cell envelope biogenesis protein TolA n=1 Tax=Methylosinus sp. H3A TaxID=2785786 RepID=UPI0018C2AA12|nr:cell envelope biogenesis protein TolA [Methylosinus sp. H3A]MBG0811888.1 cell envelope biogenesis protein TolA [Methylosinus sp. H3A]
MKPSRSQPGLIVSAAAHAGLLLATLIAFSDTKKFDDAQETVPVDIVTDAQINQVMKGEKTAKEIKPVQRADKIAEQHETKPLPPLAEAKKDVAAPPPPMKPRLEEPEDKPEAPPPPKRVAALPPTPEPPLRPTPPKAEPAKAEPQPAKAEPPKPEPPKPERAKPAPTPPEREEPEEAEVVKPKPPVRPKPEKEAKETPQPPEKPKPKEEAKKEAAKPKEPAKQLKVDEVAKLLEKKKAAEKGAPSESDEKKKSDKPPAKPKSGDESAPKSKFDAANIANLLSHEAPQRRAATGADLTKTASLGAPTANAPRMSPTLQAQIDAYTVDHYRRCWQAALSINAHSYVPRVEFRLTREGALEGAPRLLNPSSDPVEHSRGEQALAAVRRCSPMPIPAAFAPHYDYWRVTELDMREDM